MRIIEGNLLDLVEVGRFDVIVHGCNCFHTMGSGIAKEISKRYPEVLEADLRTLYGTLSKLGTIEAVRLKRNNVDFHVVNAYTQFRYGRGLQLDYNALESCMLSLKKRFPKSRIGLPMIGCGLAGGDWDTVAEIFSRTLEGLDVTVVSYAG